MAHLANTLLLSGVGVLFRYADFITVLGGTEFHLGWIVGVGMVGSFWVRLYLGDWIDRYGARPLWIGSLILFALTCFAHLYVTQCNGVAIYVLRLLYCCALAGTNGASMTFVGVRASKQRLAEMIGMLGTAGFLGGLLGTLVGDAILAGSKVTRGRVDAMFLVAGVFAVAAMPFAWAATRSERHLIAEASPSPSDPADVAAKRFLQKKPSLAAVVWRYQSVPVFIVGVAMGVGLGLPSTFLRSYAEELGISRISLFFFVYAASAIVTRWLTRDWFERFGTRNVMLLGVGGMAGSLLLLLPVHAEWHLIVPAVAFGWSQAILFPAVVAGSAVSFPPENRGLATVIALATWDIGVFVGSPAIGLILHYSAQFGFLPYPTMLCIMAALSLVILVWYAIVSQKSLRILSNRKKR